MTEQDIKKYNLEEEDIKHAEGLQEFLNVSDKDRQIEDVFVKLNGIKSFEQTMYEYFDRFLREKPELRDAPADEALNEFDEESDLLFYDDLLPAPEVEHSTIYEGTLDPLFFEVVMDVLSKKFNTDADFKALGKDDPQLMINLFVQQGIGYLTHDLPSAPGIVDRQVAKTGSAVLRAMKPFA